MMTLVEERRPVDTMSYLQQGSANGKSIIPNLDDYLRLNTDSSSLAFQAARKGHIFVLEMLLDSSLEGLYEKEKLLTTQLHNHQLHRQSLFRKRYFLHVQRLVLSDFYLKYGAAGALFLKELESEICYQLDQAIYKLALYHRSALRRAEETIIDGKRVPLNTELRVKLHREFQEKIVADANSVIISVYHTISDKNNETILIPKNLKELEYIYYTQLPTKIKNITQFVKDIDEEHQSLTDELAATLEAISQAKKAREARNFTFLSRLAAIKCFRISSELKTISTLTALPEVRSTVADEETGNTLMHEALMNGEYITALYLNEKGHSFFWKNKSGTAVVDVQDSKGNFLLLHLAGKGEYEKICDLLLDGAKDDLLNHQHQGLLDIKAGNNTFLNFIIDKINATGFDSKYMHILLMLIAKSVRIAHLLTSIGNTTPLEKLLKFPEKEQKQIFKLLKTSRKADHFASEFQSDINFAIWHDFFALLKPAPTPITTNWKNLLSGLKQDNIQQITVHRPFLESVCSHLHDAKHLKSDKALFSFLNEKLKTLKADSKTLTMYKNYLETYNVDQKKRLQGRIQLKDFYSIQSGEPARDCYLKVKSSYGAMRPQLPPASKTIEHSTVSVQNSPKKEVCFDPVFTSPKRKTNAKDVDPFHWFDQPSAKLV